MFPLLYFVHLYVIYILCLWMYKDRSIHASSYGDFYIDFGE